jgi:acyl-CoA synthetase (AMP-forming)/AMP-acid ligase II
MPTIPAALVRAAGVYGEREALVDGNVRLSWTQVLDEVRTVARAYLARGVRPGDRIAVWAPNTYHWVIAALATHFAGATLVPVNSRFTGAEALDILQRTRTKVLVVVGPFLGTDRWEQVRTAGPLPDLHTVVLIRLDAEPAAEGTLDFAGLARLADEVPAAEIDARAAAVSPEDISDILFTSGTTGRAKGVLSAHRQVLDVARAWAECGEVTADDRYLVINPFFHSFGYKAGLVVALLTGATIVPQAVYDVDAAMRLIERERITVLPGAPTIYQTMLDHAARAQYDLSSLRFAVTGAAVVPVALVERMQRELSFDLVLTAFGMTEAVVATMGRRGDPPELVSRTCGRAVAGFETRIGEHGELLLRGPNVMLGYLDDPAATAAAIDRDGWLHTGDVGALDAAGYLAITDRLKDMYICGGFNVYPAEVEQALARLEGVAAAAVVGMPEERLGEVGLAFVVPTPGSRLTEADVLAYCKERLANYKVPRRVAFVGALPRTPSGKVLKTALREEFAHVR